MRRFVGLLAGALGAVSLVLATPAGASDKGTAQKLVIGPSDVPAGYTPATVSAGNLLPEIAACTGMPVPNRKETADVSGPNLTNSTGDGHISSTAAIVKTTAMAKADLKVLKSAKFAPCAKQVEQQHQQGGITVNFVTPIREVPGGKKTYGSYSRTFVAQLRDAQGHVADVLQVAIAKGRAEVSATYLVTTPNPQTADFIGALAKLDARIKKASV
jgi:hypothetical protein